jgi:hypothetical protein
MALKLGCMVKVVNEILSLFGANLYMQVFVLSHMLVQSTLGCTYNSFSINA